MVWKDYFVKNCKSYTFLQVTPVKMYACKVLRFLCVKILYVHKYKEMLHKFAIKFHGSQKSIFKGYMKCVLTSEGCINSKFCWMVVFSASLEESLSVSPNTVWKWSDNIMDWMFQAWKERLKTKVASKKLGIFIRDIKLFPRKPQNKPMSRIKLFTEGNVQKYFLIYPNFFQESHRTNQGTELN